MDLGGSKLTQSVKHVCKAQIIALGDFRASIGLLRQREVEGENDMKSRNKS